MLQHDHVYLKVCLLLMGLLWTMSLTYADDPVAVFVEHFTVPPSTGPISHVALKNLTDAPFEGTLSINPPAKWIARIEHPAVSLSAHESRRIPFTLENATDLKSNTYPMQVIVQSDSSQFTHKQNVSCTSAPYFTPKIDGKTGDWKQAIPLTFQHIKKKTVVKTHWNKRHFFLAVEVEESVLTGYKSKYPDQKIDAVQFALSPIKPSYTTNEVTPKANRYEFLIANSDKLFSSDKCFQLLKSGDPLNLTQQNRNIADLEYKTAQVVVKRRGKITVYECAIPFAAMPTIRADVGREFYLSLLIHDPVETGIRHWSKDLALPPSPDKTAWCQWSGIKNANEMPGDIKIRWGFCSSKY